MPDPNLKLAAEELKALCRKYDIGGSFVLVSQTHTEFLYELSPSWSCITSESAGVGTAFVRIRALEKEYPSKEIHKKVLQDSVGMIVALQQMAARTEQQMSTIASKLSEKMEIIHWERDETDQPPSARG